MKYDLFSITVIGDSHIRHETVCQDASGKCSTEEYKIIAVSDGHGDPNCFRSDKGSKFAVEVCMEGLKQFAEGIHDFKMESSIEMEQEREEHIQRLKNAIVTQWNLKIQEDLEQNPITEEEYAICDKEWCNRYKNGERTNHIYGATLIGCLIFKDYIIALQQGDGRCVWIDLDGTFSQPIPWDDRCIANITTSMCNVDAASSVRHYFKKLSEENCPAAIFAASDGIEDSYSSEEMMNSFYRECCNKLVEENDASKIEEYFQEILPRISKDGSGDDMSIAGIFDRERLKPLLESFQKTNRIICLDNDIKRHERRIPDMEEKLRYFSSKLQEIKQTQEKYQENIRQLEEKKEEKQRRVNELNNQKSKLEEERKLQEKMEANKKEQQKNKNQLQQIENQIKEKKKSFSGLETLLFGICSFKVCIEKVTMYDQLGERTEEIVKKNKEEIPEARKIVSEDKEEQEKEIKQREAKKKEIKSKISQLEKEYKGLSEKHQELLRKRKDIETEVNQLEEGIKQKEEEIEDIRKAIEIYDKKQNTMESEQAQYKTEYENWKKEYEEACQEKKEMEGNE